MKEMNLETQLRSWEPRRPSAAIKRRLFPDQNGAHEFGWLMRWFAPVAACGFLAVAVFQQENGFHGMSAEDHPAALLASNLNSTVNSVASNRSPAIFEWTNRSGSALSIGSFLPGKTN